MKTPSIKTVALSVLLLLGTFGILSGCKSPSLEAGGPYTYTQTNHVGTNVVITAVSDLQLYQADVSFQTAYKAAIAVCNFELQNRDYLWKISPNIKHTIDKIRPQIWRAQVDYTTARTAYIANPTPAGLSGVDAVVAKIQQLLVATTSAITVDSTRTNSVTN
jgi:hypothetical protein